MLKSMTGYGRSKLEVEGKEYLIEIKAVNHRFIDVCVKLPRDLSYLEENIKKTVLKSVSRGKIDVSITYSNISTQNGNIKINKSLANEYIRQLKELAIENELSDNISVAEILKFPDIFSSESPMEEADIWKAFEPKICEALVAFNKMRLEEGNKLCEDILNRIDIISKNLEIISSKSTGLVEKYVVKLEARIKEILKTDIVDQNRLAEEAVIFSDKCSVEEELTRMYSHIEQFKQLINDSNAKGKKIDFLLQEMNRETNTIASKANCLEITKMVIEIKTELENIREQIQNVE